jgi:hypothetical protein
MSTEIRLIEGESIRVIDEYREVYERPLAAGGRTRSSSHSTTVMREPHHRQLSLHRLSALRLTFVQYLPAGSMSTIC